MALSDLLLGARGWRLATRNRAGAQGTGAAARPVGRGADEQRAGRGEPLVADHVQVAPHPTNRLLSVLFVAGTCLPLLLTLVAPPAQPSNDPGAAVRPAAPRTLRDVARWPTRFRRWFVENYALRRVLIRTEGRIVYSALNSSPSPTVMIGKDGWWYYRDDSALEDMISAAPMSGDLLESWRSVLEGNRRWLSGRGTGYLFMLTPDKHLIYPEFLKKGIARQNPPRLEQLQTYLSAHGSVPVLDLEHVLRTARSIERVYHRTDTHWNNRGALAAALAINEWLTRVRADTRRHSRDEFEFFTTVERGHDLPKMLGLEDAVSEEVLDVRPRVPRTAHIVEPADGTIDAARVVTENSNGRLPRMVIFRDSFMTALIPFLAEECSRCVFVWQNDLDPALIEAEHPDLVLHEIVGRHLEAIAPYDAVADWTTRRDRPDAK
jgi:alginate O-acetyltransferase complex protein AlgJ